MIINHNISAMFANRQVKLNSLNLDKNIEKLSSGYRINKAGDDASGLAVSEKLRSQIRGLHQATRNVEDAISFLQVAEGYLQETTDVIQRIRELAIQAGNGIYTQDDRLQIQVEVSQLVAEVNRIASQAQFNQMNILTGRFARPQAAGGGGAGAGGGTAGTEGGGLVFHVGPNMDQRVRIFIGNMSAQALGLVDQNGNILVSISTVDAANMAIGTIDKALKEVVRQRADIGSYQNRFEHMVRGLMVAYENMQAAESRIRDVDMAEEMVDYVKNQILTQTSVAMLAQANLKPQLVLRLLG